MTPTKNTTLVLLIKKSEGRISEICLAMKKRGLGVDKWNGVGGKLEDGETIEAAAIRETREEINVTIEKLDKVAELSFYHKENEAWNQIVNVFFVEEFEGEPEETEEMRPQWFKVSDIPYSSMWPDDAVWMPEVLEGKRVKGSFWFEGERIVREEVKIQ
jgi:8-oxo-dGTP pyrophosphatase MutT (NUDIX family)